MLLEHNPAQVVNRSMTPSGVEHFTPPRLNAAARTVNRSMTPSGVEHSSVLPYCMSFRDVNRSMTPSGVEHMTNTHDGSGAITREPFYDAIRR